MLIDIRESNSYEQFKIRDSINFPIVNLRKDKLLEQIFRFKNQNDKYIIVYGLDEKEGIPAISTFTDKGFDNVYLLSGGIEKFAISFTKLIEGTLPKEI